MNSFKILIRELHRRSLWQVMGIFLAASWGVVEVVDFLTEQVGLPDWTPTMALALLLMGLPVVLATAFVQEGMSGTDPQGAKSADPHEQVGATVPAQNLAAGTGSLDRPSTRPSQTRRLFTWRNAILGGLGAFTLLGVSLFAYFVMWTSGIGPVGNLVAQGVIEEGDPVLLAEFGNTSNDASLGGMVTEALRVDLASAHTVTLVEEARVLDVLSLMGRDAGESVRGELAREVAVRGGVKAVVDGEVGSAGSGYILVATIRATESGATLATFRRTASGPDDVIRAIDGLSQDIREKAGESLRSIKAEEPLENVTTASLEALRKFTEAEELGEQGEHGRAKALLEEALELDPEFAMAYRKLAVVIRDAGGTREEEIAAATRAHELRHRLTERERYQTIAYYHQVVTLDVEERIRAYRNILDRHPDDRSALNNLSIVYSELTQWEEAIALLERAVGGPGASAPAWTNLVLYKGLVGDFEGGHQALEDVKQRYPARDLWNTWIEYVLVWAEGDVESAMALGPVMESLPDAPPTWRSTGVRMPGVASVLAGRMTDARRHLQRAIATSRSDQRWADALQASLDLAKAERLAGTERDQAVLREMIDSGDLHAIAGPARDYGQVVFSLALSGLAEDARRLLGEWAAEGGPTATGPNYERTRQATEAVLSGLEDPGAGADALLTLRRQMDCPRCWTWTIGDFLTAAERSDEAVVERQRSLDVAEDFWFGAHRVVAHEKLGQLFDNAGDSARAAEHYSAFAELWADADTELQPRVRVARERAGAN
jgi:tetratricopeptide (TPR) repeat protein